MFEVYFHLAVCALILFLQILHMYLGILMKQPKEALLLVGVIHGWMVFEIAMYWILAYETGSYCNV